MNDPYQTQDLQYGYGQHPQAPYQQIYQPTPAQKGFFARLFDLKFDHYVTASIIKVIFIILVIVHGIWVLGLVFFAFEANATVGIVALLLAPVCWFFAVLSTRVWMELLVVIFKIKEDLGAIRNRGGF